MTLSAKAIMEVVLEATGQAMLARDFEMFAAHFVLPYAVGTVDCTGVIRTKKGLQKFFECVCDDHRRKSATRLVRICEAAEFVTPTRVNGTHITHVMTGDQRVSDPFPILSTLDFIDNRWRVTASQFAVDQYTPVGHAVVQGADIAGPNSASAFD